MIHPETHAVTLDNGPRPAGRPDHCFYCHAGVGAEHLPDCVLRRRTVVVRATIEYTINVPESWADEDIEAQRNDGSWRASNFQGELEAVERASLLGCLCGRITFEVVREASKEDEERDLLAACPELAQ